MGGRADEREQAQRLATIRWSHGRLPPRPVRWVYRRPVMAMVAGLVILALFAAPAVAALLEGSRPVRHLVFLPLGIVAAWQVVAQGKAWRRWEAASPEMLRAAAATTRADGTWLERADARNQAKVDADNALHQDLATELGASYDPMTWPLTRRQYVVVLVSGAVVFALLAVGRGLIGS